MDRLLNERLDTRDDLPILQHALMRTWAVWANDGGRAAIDLDHFERAGSLQDALRLHADEALKGLGEEDRLIAKRMFQTLTETDASNRRIRRLAHLRQIAAICGKEVMPETVMSLIQRFNEENCNFLVISSRASADDPLVDISHESLIRQGKTLADWVDEEAKSARISQRLSQSADLRDVKNLPIEDLKTVKTLYRAKMDKDARQQLQRINKELFTKPCDTWFDMTTPYNVDRKDICE